MKRKIAALTLLLVMAVSLSSCMKMEVDITIKNNGKMDAKILYAVSEQVMAMAESDEFGYSEEDLAEMKKNGWKVEEYREDGYFGYVMTQNNVSTKAIRQALANDEGDSSASEMLTKNGSTYVLDLPLGGLMPESSEDDMFDTMGMLRSFGASLKFRITFPSKPISHNATKVSEDGKTLEWDLLELKEGETVHAEFKAGGGFLRYALIMSAVVLAVCLIGFLGLKKKKAAAPVPNTEQVSYSYAPEATPVYPEPQQTEWVSAPAEPEQAVPSDTETLE